jgi:hypothetical protein
MQRREDEYGSFTHTTFSLTDNIHPKYGLGDAFMLNLGGVFKATIHNGTETFRLENEVLETRCMNSYIVTPGWEED